jgi:hypothetical protein
MVARASGIVTLMSDFGVADAYVAAMKGAILTRAPQAILVDVTHQIDRHDVVAGAFVLASAARHFPSGTVHLAVVDPAVGSDRKAVAVEARGSWYVGPDNGLLSRAVGHGGRCIEILGVPGLDLDPSPTFHGRDLFAPVAAFLATGGRLEDLGRPATLQQLSLRPPSREGSRVVGEVVHIDHFGNAVTNVRADDLEGAGSRVTVTAGSRRVRGLARVYADVERGALCALIGSDGYLELAVREGSAADTLGIVRGAGVVCEWSA